MKLSGHRQPFSVQGLLNYLAASSGSGSQMLLDDKLKAIKISTCKGLYIEFRNET